MKARRFSKLTVLLGVLAGLFVLQGTLCGEAEAEGQVTWKNGLIYTSEDGAQTIKIGGRIYNDWVWMAGDDDLDAAKGNLEDGAEVRAARISVSGTLWGSVDFNEHVEFAGGAVAFKDAWIGLRGVPVLGRVRVGLMREPSGLRTSSKYITFMERSIAERLARGRNTGLLATNTASDGRAQWAAGVFRATGEDAKGAGDGEYSVTGRVTGLPRHTDGGRGLVHLGVSASYVVAPGDTIRFRERPETHLTPRFVDTKNIGADAYQVVGLEAGVVEGPVFLQGEVLYASVDKIEGESPAFTGYSVEASVFLTGEHRTYSKSSGTFGRVKPKENFDTKTGGSGAWELAARVSGLDLDDADVTGGKLTDITVGVNWYLNPNARVMANYVRADLDGVGTANIGQARVQVDF